MSSLNTIAQTGFIGVCLLLTSVQRLHAADKTTHAADPRRTIPRIVIYDFVSDADSAAPKTGPGGSACENVTIAPGTAEVLAEAPDLPSTITHEITKKLESEYEAVSATAATPVTVGTLVLAGCLTEANPGNAAKRLVGMGMGSSRLAAHVVVSRQTSDGLVAIGSFDAAVKGGNMLPPLGPAGLAVHAVKETRQTMDAQSRKLAGKIVKQLKKSVAEPVADESSTL